MFFAFQDFVWLHLVRRQVSADALFVGHDSGLDVAQHWLDARHDGVAQLFFLPIHVFLRILLFLLQQITQYAQILHRFFSVLLDVHQPFFAQF
jgi:hypothetical protein